MIFEGDYTSGQPVQTSIKISIMSKEQWVAGGLGDSEQCYRNVEKDLVTISA